MDLYIYRICGLYKEETYIGEAYIDIDVGVGQIE